MYVCTFIDAAPATNFNPASILYVLNLPAYPDRSILLFILII